MTVENHTQTTQTTPNTSSAPLDGQSTASTATPGTTTETTTTTPPAEKGKSVMMPSGALKKLKEAEREKGRKSALALLDEEAKKLGFANHEALKLAAAQAKAKPNTQANKTNGKANTATPKPTEPSAETQQPNDRSANRYQREAQQLLEDKRRLNKRKNILEKQLAERDSLLQRETTMRQLSRMASRAGIHGDDENEMAVSLYEKHVSQLSDEELESFDDEKFFSEHLRKSKPYLYGVREVPATTSATAPAATSATTPTATSTTTTATSGGRVDTMKMSRKEFADYLASRGLTSPANGT